MTKEANRNLPKATHKGKIGNLDVYVLEDGRCVLSKGSAAMQLLSSAKTSDFDRFCERLSSKVKDIALPPTFEFLTTEHRVALAIDDESFANVVEVLVDGLVMNTIDPRQVETAQRAYALQKSYARIGLHAHILAAAGVEPRTMAQVIGCFADRVLRRDKRDWEKRFNSEFVSAICQVYGWRQDGHRIPRQMAAVFDKLYRLILGASARAELKERCPNPTRGDNQHQWICDELDREFPAMTGAITYIARRSGRSVKYFWLQVEEYLGVTQTQTELQLSVRKKAS
jgi:hypothetical protein